jgi:hypothetical protein
MVSIISSLSLVGSASRKAMRFVNVSVSAASIVPSVPADATIVCLSHAALDSSGSDGGSTVSENGESTCSKDF